MNSTDKKILDLAVQKVLQPDYNPDTVYSNSVFMIFSLPTRRIFENPAYWVKEISSYKLTITRHDKYEIPYGCYARMNQIFIDTEIITKHTTVIDVGRSFSEYTQKLGYHRGWANRALLKQLINFITCVIRVEPKIIIPRWAIGLHSTIAHKWDVYFDVSSPDQIMMSRGQIFVSKEYADWIYHHAVPMDMNIVRCFKHSTLALDLYRYLVYRNNGLKKPVSFNDTALFDQLGTDISQEKVIRFKLKNILKRIQKVWTGLDAQFIDGHFELKPSEPSVKRNLLPRN